MSRGFGLSPIRRFLRLDLPFATPALVWNAMMSMSGGWFFVVASEAITVGNTTVTLPGIGSWLALAIERQDFRAIGEAVAMMAAVILLYDQLFFRPIVAWADRFRFEQTASNERPSSWVYDLLRRTRLLPLLFAPITTISRLLLALDPRQDARAPRARPAGEPARRTALADPRAAGRGAAPWWSARYVLGSLDLRDIGEAFRLACLTMLRVIVLIALASLVTGAGRHMDRAQSPNGPRGSSRWRSSWRLSRQMSCSRSRSSGSCTGISARHQAVAADDPGHAVVHPVQRHHRAPAPSPMIFAKPPTCFGVRGWQWWRQVALPGVFPFYVTGALTASGGSAECLDRRRGGHLGRLPSRGAGPRHLYRQGDDGRGLSARRARHRRDVAVRARLHRLIVAADNAFAEHRLRLA